MQILNTTLCYIEQKGKYLMLHRVKKQNDINKDKWIGVGGKVEFGVKAVGIASTHWALTPVSSTHQRMSPINMSIAPEARNTPMPTRMATR